MIQYQKFDQGSWIFPKPRVPALPTLGRHSLQFFRPVPAQPLAKASNTRLYARSRYALTDAYRLCAVGGDTTLLAPAYHCRTMLDPAIRLGADVRLYPLRPDLAPDLDGLEACLANSVKPVSALLVTHYFGFAKRLEPLLEFCEHHNIALIEDCSHCLIAPSAASNLGRVGRYSVWSPYKFFPCEDGGVLWANHGATLPLQPPRSPGLVCELKGFARSLQRSWENRMSFDTSALDQDIQALRGGATGVSHDMPQSSAETSAQYDVNLEGLESLAWSRWIMRHTDVARMSKRRRQNYHQWAQASAGLPHCHALLPTLPDGCVPYMFPLFIDRPDVHFPALKCLGMTEWRWDDMAISPCRIAMDYRLHLLHLPCHQEISSSQMAWMTMAVSKVLAQIPVKGLVT